VKKTLLLLLALGIAGFCQDAKRLSRAEAMSAAVDKIQPEYPAIAKQLNIEGQVELEAVVSESGSVEQVKIVAGNPVLTRPAVDALKRWKFSPVTANGKAVKAVAPVAFTFKK
jgi:protein TonB